MALTADGYASAMTECSLLRGTKPLIQQNFVPYAVHYFFCCSFSPFLFLHVMALTMKVVVFICTVMFQAGLLGTNQALNKHRR